MPVDPTTIASLGPCAFPVYSNKVNPFTKTEGFALVIANSNTDEVALLLLSSPGKVAITL